MSATSAVTLVEREARLAELYQLRRRVQDEIVRERNAIASAKERASAVRAAVPAVNANGRPAARCGTDGGYYRHRRTYCCVCHHTTQPTSQWLT